MELNQFQNRLQKIQALSLSAGSHKEFEIGMCVMEAVSYVAGEPWSDAPSCACPVITSFCVSWNDSLPNDAERDRLLKPLIALIVGTRSTPAVEKRRSYMALDWLIRVHTPAFLDLEPALCEHSKALRGLDAIVDMADATAAGAKTRAARDAAWHVAGDAAAAREAAAVVVVAGDAAAARAAAGVAAGDAAAAAVLAAAGSAAGAGDALRFTVKQLQDSALALVHRMIAQTE